MEIKCDRKERKLWLSQTKYIQQVLDKFNMKNAQPIETLLMGHFKSNLKQSPSNEMEISEMKNIPYSFTARSIIYAMICTSLDVVHAVDVISTFLANPSKKHWIAIK